MLLKEKTPNRLIHEKSPYLLQHANNPVDWFPWCDEAFEKAKIEDKPVFISIGYSTCHWCHVMARESFEDAEVAALLNRDFISIKADREERPDVDHFCMQACQLMTGSGGWPLSVFMTPERRPFYAGTYFPKRGGHGRIGFMDLLEAIDEKWRTERASLLGVCGRITEAVRELQDVHPGEISRALVERCFSELVSGFDAQYGGFGRAPKFPTPHVLMFLLRYHALTSDVQALRMAQTTLNAMARGGVYDQLGGGFCRYSTDRRWLAPHFEKMLYDNALLALAYVEAHQLTGAPEYARVAAETLDFVLREMRHERGGFFAAQDADTEGREGAYYLFTYDEVIGVLGSEKGARVCEALDITPGGNFEGQSIPNRLRDGAPIPEDLRPSLDLLYQYRRRRMKLGVDDKILTGWNALMIAALAAASAALDRPDYLEAALDALKFLEAELTGADRELRVRWRDGEAYGQGGLDDYAMLCWALTKLYDATLDNSYLVKARALMDQLIARFGGESGSGYYLSADHGELAVRPMDSGDNALPSGNSMVGVALARLSAWSGDPDLLRLLDGQLQYIAGAAEGHPSGHAFGLIAGMMRLYPGVEAVCAAVDEQEAEAFRRFTSRRLLPNAIALINAPGRRDGLPEWAGAYGLLDGRTAYYICRDGMCGLPTHDLNEVEHRMSSPV